ncbi:MAG TPA: POTRA domain-containing protein [Polyangiaceae bacterium]
MRLARLVRLVSVAVLFARGAFGQVDAQPGLPRLPELPAAPNLDAFEGKPIVSIRVVTRGGRWEQNPKLDRVRVGQALSAEVVRTALQELLDSARYAEATARVETAPDGVELVLDVLPRRVVVGLEATGSPLPTPDLFRGGAFRIGGDVTAKTFPNEVKRIEGELERRGFPNADVDINTFDTDEPLEVVVSVEVRAGSERAVADRWFGVWPDPDAPGLHELLKSYAISVGDRADAEQIEAADRELALLLRSRGFHGAEVTHRVEPRRSGALLRVNVRAGSLIKLVFEGNRHFDAAALESALELEESEDRDPVLLADRLRKFYIERGFLDAEVRAELRGAANATVRGLAFVIRESRPVRVVAREYPCLTGVTPADVGSEIDSFLSELPGSELLGPVDENGMNELFGPGVPRGTRAAPYSPSPWTLYVPEVYDQAIEHLQDVFRSRGYLSAVVGPPAIVRRACDARSPAGRCIPVGPRRRPRTECRYDEVGLPVAEPAPEPALTCVPDPKKGRSCEPEAVLHLPIKLGPQTILYDVEFEGNSALVERDLALAAALSAGEPVSHVELENARRRIVDAYAEEGFAFAEVEVNLDLSPDHTRGRVRYVVSERDRVRVARIDVRGARVTNESLIRRRIALEVGGLYRRSLVRLTEERLGQLGVFSGVTVGFEDPYVPAREKVVVVNVVESKPQYLDVRPGFATGEGFRITFEYGHRNVAGEAIQLVLHTQLSYLPSAFILEEDVRKSYDELDVSERLERRNTAQVEFPDIGLGPLFRLSVEGVDVRDNSRDYGLTKDAALVTLHFRPGSGLWFQLGGSLERNDAAIFGAEEKGALEDYIVDNPSQANTFRVPEGVTRVIAERFGVTWDRRDNPLEATRGTVVSLDVEHVNALPIEEDAIKPGEIQPCEEAFRATKSDFFRFQGRFGGYLRLSKRGLALALSYRAGVIAQTLPDKRNAAGDLVQCSRTYPDRLFFLGGVDTVRGFAQDSMVPEDVAQQLLDDAEAYHVSSVPVQSAGDGLDINSVVIRGGDAYVNPRAELRIPLTDSVQTALFVDAGNLWTDPSKVQPFDLRYATGSGLRVATPIGPLVFDYGFNVDRVLDRVVPNRRRQRTWESLGAFHFSIGVF